MRQWVLILVGLWLGAGCSLPRSDLPPVRIYTLQAPVPPTVEKAFPAHLVVSVNYVSPALASNRIMVMPDPNRYDFLANAAWPATTPIYLRDLMLRTFLDSRAFRSVGAAPRTGEINYSLNLQVYDFEAVYEAGQPAPRIQVRLVGLLGRLDLGQRGEETVYVAEAGRDATDNSLGAIVTAFESAFQQVALEIQASVTRDLRQQLRKPPGAG
ncbi:MAG TPA: hypothetical protein EYP40_03220 [Chromatiales bacterium]|nr:hypothetical protein [Chromatiales bacterium]